MPSPSTSDPNVLVLPRPPAAHCWAAARPVARTTCADRGQQPSDPKGTSKGTSMDKILHRLASTRNNTLFVELISGTSVRAVQKMIPSIAIEHHLRLLTMQMTPSLAHSRRRSFRPSHDGPCTNGLDDMHFPICTILWRKATASASPWRAIVYIIYI